MKTYVVVQEKLSFTMDWSRLYEPEQYRLILINTPAAYDGWGVTQQVYFDRIYVESPLTYEAVHKIMSIIVKKYPDDSIYIVTNEEVALSTCARIRKSFGLEGDSEEVIARFRDKALMKACLIDHGLTHVLPRFKTFNPADVSVNYAQELVDYLGLPVFCKPTAEAASTNTCILHSTAEISDWIQNNMNRAAGEFEFDEFIKGVLYHCDSIVKDNKILHVQVARYINPCFDYTRGRPLGSIVVPPHDPMHDEILKFNESVFNGLKVIPNCVTHHEMFKTEDGRLIFVEIAARAPGVLICPIHELHIGVDLKLVHYKLQMGLVLNLQIKPGFYAGWARFPKKPGKVTKLNYPTHLKSNYNFDHHREDATTLRYNPWLPESNIILWNTDYDVLKEDYETLQKFSPTETIEE